ncbi:glycosyltransferase family 4 protein [Acidisoma sp. 7E03]
MSENPGSELGRKSVVVDIGPLREPFYTGIPNVIAALCSRFLADVTLDVYFDMDGRWIDNEAVLQCLSLRSGSRLIGQGEHFLPADSIRELLDQTGKFACTAALYTDYRPPVKRYPREGKIVHDLSMILTPECHPPEAAAIYVHDLSEQIALSDVLFCVSEATARDLRWIYGVDSSRIKVALLGSNVDLTAVERMRSLIGARRVEPFLLILGSIEPRKNNLLVLRWLSEHREILSEMRVVFAGRQAWGKTFSTMVEECNLQDAVTAGKIVYADFVDEKYRTALLVGASALIYASVYEGFGLPCLEAMVAGTPVLGSVSSSIPEVLGDCAYYFDPCSVASLHNAYLSWKDDQSSGFVSNIVSKARLRATQFDFDQTYKVIIDGLFQRS